MRVIKILRELNIGLASLNQEMKFLKLPEFQINDKISEADYSFIKSYFQSTEMKDLEILIKKVNEQKMLLKKFFLKEPLDIYKMGQLVKMQLFNYINEQEHSITKPKINTYSETNFLKLYNWYINWIKLTKIQQLEREEEYMVELLGTQHEANRKSRDFSVIDEESNIMSALCDGYGDIYGF